jgi:hypothetical protein
MPDTGPFATIFRRLKEAGQMREAVLRELLADDYFCKETFYCDFKKDARTFTDNSTEEAHKRNAENLGKALSGFANSSGGILLFGVEDPEKIKGRSQSLPGCLEPAEFERLVLQQVQSLTIPSVPDVDTLLIPIANTGEKGVVVILIPSSPLAPHMLIYNKDRRYYVREGDGFVPADHQRIADLFGRRPQPHLKIIQTWINDGFTVSCLIRIKNDGRAVAKCYKIELEYGDPLKRYRSMKPVAVRGAHYCPSHAVFRSDSEDTPIFDGEELDWIRMTFDTEDLSVGIRVGQKWIEMTVSVCNEGQMSIIDKRMPIAIEDILKSSAEKPYRIEC